MQKPPFPDCCHPQDCQCAARGLQDEATECLVPAVAAAAGDWTIALAALSLPSARPMAATSYGNVQLIGNSGHLAADAVSALNAIQAGDPFNVKLMDRLIKYEMAQASLRAEAGYGTGLFSLLLHVRRETPANGGELTCFLMLANTEVGDAVFWNVDYDDQNGESPDIAVACATTRMRDALFNMIRAAAGGTRGDVSEYWTEVPSEDELQAMLEN